MRILLTGSHGLVGSALQDTWAHRVNDVRRLVRGRPGPNDFLWDPMNGVIDESALDGVDAVVHLAGAGIGDRPWTKKYMKTILDSRVNGTTLLAETMAKRETPPAVLVCASAIGYYGDRGDEVLTEYSEPGTGFGSEVVKEWEASTEAASSANIRVVNIRSGLILSRNGGLLGRLKVPFKVGLGAKFGNGQQWFSWVHIDDEVRAIDFAIDEARLSGPVNITAPNAVRFEEFAKTFGKVLHRPVFLTLPRFIFQALPNGMGDELLGSQRVDSSKIQNAGFVFNHSELRPALADLFS